MIAFYLTLLLPLFGAIIMVFIGNLRVAAYCNAFISVAGFISSLFVVQYFFRHGAFLALGQQCYIDAFNLLIILLTTFIVMTTAFFSRVYMQNNVESRRVKKSSLRFYYCMYQLFALMMLVALCANNIGILWVAMEGATLATVLLVSFYRTKEAVEAAWKYFILCIVGIALALFGTVLIYFSATQDLLQDKTGIFWNILAQHATHFDPAIIKLAFVFLLVGYGTKIGLVPLHNWLPDAYSESPAPVSALLSSLLSTVAIYALLRFKIIVDGALANNLAGHLMMVFGLLSFTVAVVSLQRQRNIKRLLSYSSIEHMGLVTFAFGCGGAPATFIGLFYLLINSLTKSAVFMVIGNVVQQTGTQSLEKMRGLVKSYPLLGWVLIITILVISGMPPFGVFTGEIMLFINSVKLAPVFGIILLCGLIMALAGMLRHIQPVVYGDAMAITRLRSSLFPIILHLSFVLVLGGYLPPMLRQLLQQATGIFVF